MATVAPHQEYELRFGPDEKRIPFRANGVVQAIIRAVRLIQPGSSATLLEDGAPIGVLAHDGRLTVPERCRSQRDSKSRLSILRTQWPNSPFNGRPNPRKDDGPS